MCAKPLSCEGSTVIPANSSVSNATWQSLSRRWHCSSAFGLRSPRHCPRARRLPPRQRGRSAIGILSRRWGAGCSGATASCARSASRSGRSSGATVPRQRFRATLIVERRREPMPADPTRLSRSTRMLRTALGPDIAASLEDPDIVEVMLNPDGRLWIDRLSSGLEDTGRRIPIADGERIVRLVAHHVGVEAHAGSPRVSAELPETGERFEGLLPPVVTAPAFAIRKPAVAVFTLDDYVTAGIMTAAQAATLRTAVAERWNVLVAGGTSTGKTTLVNALLHEVVTTGDRVVLIEDTRELQCAAPNLVAMRTKDGIASLTDLVRSSLRLRPDRIPIGEVRGAEALDLLKAWGTGHPGGVGTIHAGSALGALRRLEQLIQEAVVTVPRALIAETIDVVAVLSGRGRERRLTELMCVTGLAPDGDYVLSPAGDQP